MRIQNLVELFGYSILILFPLSNVVLGFYGWSIKKWVPFLVLAIVAIPAVILGSIPAMDELRIINIRGRTQDLVVLGIMFSFGLLAILLEWVVWFRLIKKS